MNKFIHTILRTQIYVLYVNITHSAISLPIEIQD